MNNLFLYFPQWQGSGKTNELFRGAKQIINKLNTYNWSEVPVVEQENLLIENQILGYSSISKQLEDATKIINNYNPEKIFTVGGGCDVEIAPVTYLNKQYDGNLSIIWLDAHGDLNTPTSSPSKNFHGMPLRTILGEGDSTMLNYVSHPIKPDQIYLIGVRELDRPENEYIQKNQLKVFQLANEEVAIQLASTLENKNIYIHIDLDVIDPLEFPDVKCPTNQGISLHILTKFLSSIKNVGNIVGGSVVEYVPNDQKDSSDVPVELFKLLVDKSAPSSALLK